MKCKTCGKVIDERFIYRIIGCWWEDPQETYEHNECSNTPFVYGWGHTK